MPGSLECRQKPRAFIILPPTISAQITTKDSFSFTYGVVEVRARLPKGDWIYPGNHTTAKKYFFLLTCYFRTLFKIKERTLRSWTRFWANQNCLFTWKCRFGKTTFWWLHFGTVYRREELCNKNHPS